MELEAKMLVPDHEATRQRLRDLHATGGGMTHETNIFFDTPEQSLLKSGSGVRLRINRDADTGREEHVITHKGPLLPGVVKAREETELTVADAVDAVKLLEALGFRRTISFQKRRESWKLDACKVELDEVPHLGRYVEIEGPDEPTIMRLRDDLGLGERKLIKTGYIGMLTAYLSERGEATRDIVFP